MVVILSDPATVRFPGTRETLLRVALRHGSDFLRACAQTLRSRTSSAPRCLTRWLGPSCPLTWIMCVLSAPWGELSTLLARVCTGRIPRPSRVRRQHGRKQHWQLRGARAEARAAYRAEPHRFPEAGIAGRFHASSRRSDCRRRCQRGAMLSAQALCTGCEKQCSIARRTAGRTSSARSTTATKSRCGSTWATSPSRPSTSSPRRDVRLQHAGGGQALTRATTAHSPLAGPAR